MSCPEHPFAYLVEDDRAGDVICTECGLVVGDRIVDVASNWPQMKSASPSKVHQQCESTAQEICARLCLPSAFEQKATALFNNFGCVRDGDSKAAASVYLACKEFGSPRSLKEICAASPATEKQTSKAVFKMPSKRPKYLPNNPDGFVQRICARLDLPFAVIKASLKLAGSESLSGFSPVVRAAASVCVTAKVSIRVMTTASGASPSKIRKAIKALQHPSI